ncbi:hypothetical protein F4826_004750 [Rahnella inusitata]|nr:hypothetical protein [Rahnella inusitata]
MTKMNYKDREKLKFITLPVMIHRDDHDWVRLQLSFIHERYRLKVAFLYSKLFFNYYNNSCVTELKRSNYARHKANNFLRKVVTELLNVDLPKNH